ncbi:hypothetical protein B0H19DRAFT_1232461 [Mycena capillaripes]|nr:hypothetical protein B0H19DRAFT_1232461 [Mycena capillaripes]
MPHQSTHPPTASTLAACHRTSGWNFGTIFLIPRISTPTPQQQVSEPGSSAPRSRRSRQEVDEANIIHTTRTRVPSARKRGADDDDEADVTARPPKKSKGKHMCRASLVYPANSLFLENIALSTTLAFSRSSRPSWTLQHVDGPQASSLSGQSTSTHRPTRSTEAGNIARGHPRPPANRLLRTESTAHRMPIFASVLLALKGGNLSSAGVMETLAAIEPVAENRTPDDFALDCEGRAWVAMHLGALALFSTPTSGRGNWTQVTAAGNDNGADAGLIQPTSAAFGSEIQEKCPIALVTGSYSSGTSTSLRENEIGVYFVWPTPRKRKSPLRPAPVAEGTSHGGSEQFGAIGDQYLGKNYNSTKVCEINSSTIFCAKSDLVSRQGAQEQLKRRSPTGIKQTT